VSLWNPPRFFIHSLQDNNSYTESLTSVLESGNGMLLIDKLISYLGQIEVYVGDNYHKALPFLTKFASRIADLRISLYRLSNVSSMPPMNLERLTLAYLQNTSKSPHKARTSFLGQLKTILEGQKVETLSINSCYKLGKFVDKRQ
jgi:hypothetical protein